MNAISLFKPKITPQGLILFGISHSFYSVCSLLGLINSVVRDARPVETAADGNIILCTLFYYNQPVAIVEVKSITTTTNHGVIWPSLSSFSVSLLASSILSVYRRGWQKHWYTKDDYFVRLLFCFRIWSILYNGKHRKNME